MGGPNFASWSATQLADLWIRSTLQLGRVSKVSWILRQRGINVHVNPSFELRELQMIKESPFMMTSTTPWTLHSYVHCKKACISASSVEFATVLSMEAWTRLPLSFRKIPSIPTMPMVRLKGPSMLSLWVAMRGGAQVACGRGLTVEVGEDSLPPSIHATLEIFSPEWRPGEKGGIWRWLHFWISKYTTRWKELDVILSGFYSVVDPGFSFLEGGSKMVVGF